jgi:hypothetical protein
VPRRNIRQTYCYGAQSSTYELSASLVERGSGQLKCIARLQMRQVVLPVDGGQVWFYITDKLDNYVVTYAS